MKKLKIGIVGCGAIGSAVAVFLKKEFRRFAQVAVCYDVEKKRAVDLQSRVGCSFVSSLDELIESSDFVIEAACAKDAGKIASGVLSRGKDVLVMSVGGILGMERKLSGLSRKYGARLHLPSGAVCGLDGIRALSLVGIQKITLRTYKPANALEGADYIVSRKINLGRIKAETLIFSGTSKQAVRAFPQNINVVALLQYAASGRVEPEVEIYCSPGLKRNVHKIEVISRAARLCIECENVPSPMNPKTSYLAILSAIRTAAEAAGAFG